MLSASQRKFCEEIVRGLNATDAYAAGHPRCNRRTAGKAGRLLLRRPEVQEEIARMIRRAEELAGSAVMDRKEVLEFLTAIKRARPALIPEDSELWQSIKRTRDGVEFRLPDKLSAIARWCDLSSEGAEAEAHDSLHDLLRRIQK